MPGINLIAYKDRDLKDINPSGTDAIYEDDFISISKNIPYSHYPVQSWETGEFIITVEGFFFEWTDYRMKIEKLAEACFTTSDKSAVLKNFSVNNDAEFIIIIYNKIFNSAIVFNDVLGRFPLYISESKKYLILSRNVSFINLFHRLSPNPPAFLESLSFGFSLGSKTLYKEIERLPGGIIIELEGGAFSKKRYHEFNYELMIEPAVDKQEEMQEIMSLFVESVRNRSRFADLNILSLSGGLDSRAVAGGFELSGLPYQLMTYSDKEGYALEDIKYARQIAASLGMPLKILDLPEPDISDFEQYFNLKYGLNALDMTFLLNFYRNLVDISERPALFTGDGGDKLFPDLGPPSFIKSPGSIVNYAIRANSKMRSRAAARILRQDKYDLPEEIFNIIRSYPESNWQYKYVHFIMDNRVANWLAEGEDRNRCFMTSFSPFYNERLFRKLMSVPLHQKKNFALYDRFLKQISPETYNIPNANWGFATSAGNRIGWIYLKQDLKRTPVGAGIKALVRKRQNRLTELTSVEKVLLERSITNTNIARQFDIIYAKGLKYFNSDNFLNMITLLKAAGVQYL